MGVAMNRKTFSILLLGLLLVALAAYFAITATDTKFRFYGHDQLISPRGLAYDAKTSSILVADELANAVFSIDIKTGNTARVSGKFLGYDISGLPVGGYSDGAASQALFNKPTDVAVLPSGAIVVADKDNHAIRQIYKGRVTTLAGGRGEGYQDGRKQNAKFSYPSALAYDSKSNIYVSDTENDAIRKIDYKGNVSTLKTTVKKPSGMTIVGDELYVAELETSSIVKINLSKDKGSNLERILGGERGYLNGNLEIAKIAAAHDVFVLGSDIFVADTGNHTIRKLTKKNKLAFAETIVGGGMGSLISGENILLNAPKSVCVAEDRLFISDTDNLRVIGINRATKLGRAQYYEKCEIEDSANIYVNGSKLEYRDVRPVVIKGRTYVPARLVMESLGARVDWIDSEQALVLEYGDKKLKLKREIILIKDRSMVPLRFMVEKLGMKINWIGDLRVIEIDTY